MLKIPVPPHRIQQQVFCAESPSAGTHCAKEQSAPPRVNIACMNPDRATLSFLNAFPESAREEGKRLHDEGCVTQIFGNHLFIQARVEDAAVYRTSLRLQGNEWVGECSADEPGIRDACLYATMLERMQRGENLPESPNEVGDQSLADILEEKLDRTLEEAEDLFLEKLQKRFRRYEMEQELYDHDLVRLNSKWEIAGYDPLKLWPVPPRDIIEFWNYIAYAFRKKNLKIPEFISPITDLQRTEEKMGAWEKEHELLTWRSQIEKFVKTPPSDEVEQIRLRLVVTTNEAKLEYSTEGEGEFTVLSQKGDLARFMERFEEGGLHMDPISEVIWFALVQNWNVTDDLRFRFDSEEACRLFNRLFNQEELGGSMVTLDEEPFRRVEKPLRWICESAEEGSETVALQMVTGEGEPVSHVLRVLPGVRDLYLSDETIFNGPKCWLEDTEILPRYEIPKDVLESETGVEFLGKVDAELPPELRKRVRDETLQVRLKMKLSSSVTAAHSEHLVVEVSATDGRGTREETLGKGGWEVTHQSQGKGAKNRIMRYNRAILHHFPRWLEPMLLAYDNNLESFKARVTRNFPSRFVEWVARFPEDVIIEADEALESLLQDPVKASVSFEVVEKEIDWFDLKVIVNVDGFELSPEEIRALVAARGGYVRMKEGGWLRLEIDLQDKQKEAVERLGLDPFDLTGETHRMHVLQLAEPLAKEVFDAKAWDNICKRAASIKLQVRPRLPSGLKVDLRPYQVEGFHYLAYLSTNHFGGILADDMGLGKTVQSLAWLLWLRGRNKEERPSLVVCPKSVLDVWAGEVEKFAPGLRVQVLRNKVELDLDKLASDVDLLVVNYSQLRVCAEKLTGVEWLSIILDEGQQIKNPDSKAAKTARMLKGENRLVLTGTPIENRLLDIWSLMAFAMPGVLGDRKYFREHFDKRKDSGSQIRLAARLRPFLLRRTKGQVAMDLPPRTEEDVLCVMEGVQEELYKNELERIQTVLLRAKTEEALNKERFVILQGLMRLRQISCHPGLIDKKHLQEESAKLTALFYLLDQLREEGHKVLVFSQFVTMLDIIREKMETEDRAFHYLTGQTKERHKVIEEFQTTKDPSVFLLSLKAGGSGLNLTAASYVVLYDPWWNPAVESQAIDRTHRIGQKSNVIAYRLLMRNSVEEKIRTLQAQKQEMSAGVLGEESFTRNLRMKDLRYLFNMDGKASQPEAEEILIEE